eukprot:7636425-Lingulodinium_polyedra.AAC.1
MCARLRLFSFLEPPSNGMAMAGQWSGNGRAVLFAATGPHMVVRTNDEPSCKEAQRTFMTQGSADYYCSCK